MNQTSNYRATQIASFDFSTHASEDTLRQSGASGHAHGAGRSRDQKITSRAESDGIPSVQAALNAFRQSISLLDA